MSAAVSRWLPVPSISWKPVAGCCHVVLPRRQLLTSVVCESTTGVENQCELIPASRVSCLMYTCRDHGTIRQVMDTRLNDHEPRRFSWCQPSRNPTLNSDIKTCRGNIANSDGRFMTAIEAVRAVAMAGLLYVCCNWMVCHQIQI